MIPTQQVRGGDAFAKILADDRHDRPPAYQFTMERMFQDVSIADKSVLDIGSGRGLTTLWLALQGAKRVVSMEPELEGSRSGVVALQRARIAELGLHQVEVVTSAFEHYEPQVPFDLIVSNASINHLNETRTHALRSQEAFDAFVAIASQLRRWLAVGGVVVVTDACRYSLWTQAMRFGLPKTLCYSRLRTIDWRLHQQPEVWKRIFAQAGFSDCRIDYPVPYRLRNFAWVMNSAPAAWLLQGEFILTAIN